MTATAIPNRTSRTSVLGSVAALAAFLAFGTRAEAQAPGQFVDVGTLSNVESATVRPDGSLAVQFTDGSTQLLAPGEFVVENGAVFLDPGVLDAGSGFLGGANSALVGLGAVAGVGLIAAAVSSGGDDDDDDDDDVIVDPGNSAPTFTSPDAINVEENSLATGLTVAADDADGDAVTFSITGGADADLFTIDEGTGELSFNEPADFETPGDADANNVFEVEVSASDGEATATQTLQITVDNVNDLSPVIQSAGEVTVTENATDAIQVVAVDGDGDDLTFALSGTDAALFAIDAATGAVTFLEAPDFENPADADGDNVYEVTVTASDGTNETSQDITITVADDPEGAGTDGDDLIVGTNEADLLDALGGDDAIAGLAGGDTISTGEGADVLIYNGDPFEGADVSAEGRQIVGGEDTITDFDFDSDAYQFNAADFGLEPEVSFVSLDANAEGAEIPAGANVIVLLNSDNDSDAGTVFNAGAAAAQIASLVEDPGPGFFVYFNSGLGVNRLVYSTDLSSADADLKIVSRQSDLQGQEAIDALASFTADNFVLSDTITGTNGDDDIAGTNGNDNIAGSLGADVVDGGDGLDLLTYDNLDVASGDVTVRINDDGTVQATVADADGNVLSDDTISNVELFRFTDGTFTAEEVVALAQDDDGDGDGDGDGDVITGTDGDDTLTGTDGDDTIAGSLGADVVDGGAGTDLLTYDNLNVASGDVLVEVRDNGTVQASVAGPDGTFVSDDNITNVEQFRFTDGTFTAEEVVALASTVEGTDGSDTGDDAVQGTDGNDVIVGSPGTDTIDGGEGTDLLTYDNLGVASGDVTVQVNLSGTVRASVSDGQGGFVSDDTISNVEFFRFTDGTFTAAEVAALATTIQGTADDDVITGTDNVETILGGNGNDVIDGLGGADTINGGNGDDTVLLTTFDSGEVLQGGAGINTLDLSGLDLGDTGATINQRTTTLQITGDEDAGSVRFAGFQNLVGTEAADNIIAGGAGNRLDGGGGADTIATGGGSDRIVYQGDAFAGQDVSAEGRQVVGGDDSITDFNFGTDAYALNAADFGVTGDVSFAAVDANATEPVIPEGTNVIVLLNSNDDADPDAVFNAGAAANQIAELVDTEGAGFFVYYNSDLGVNRLVYSSDLSDASADLRVLSRQTDLEGVDAIDALASFTADNFVFEDVPEAVSLTEPEEVQISKPEYTDAFMVDLAETEFQGAADARADETAEFVQEAAQEAISLEASLLMLAEQSQELDALAQLSDPSAEML